MTVMFSDALRREINFVSLGKRHRGILEQSKRKTIMLKRRQNAFFSAVIHCENLDRAGTDSLSRPVCQKEHRPVRRFGVRLTGRRIYTAVESRSAVYACAGQLTARRHISLR